MGRIHYLAYALCLTHRRSYGPSFYLRTNLSFTLNQRTNGDYIGCYDLRCLHFDYDVDGFDNLTTPDSCTATCKENGFSVAGVYNGTKCSCSIEQTCRNKPLDDKKCGLPCRSAPFKLCGGYTAVSVYTVHLSVPPSNSTCDTTTEKINTTPKDRPPGDYTYTALIGISFIVVIIVVIIRTRRGTHRPSSPSRPRSESPPSERTITHDRQDTSRYEPATLPRTRPLPQPLSLTVNDSTSRSDSLSRRPVDSDTDSNFYFTLVAEDGKNEARVGGIPDTGSPSEGTVEYGYADLAEISTSFHRVMAEKKGADDDSTIDEDGMVVNELYAIPHKTRGI